MAERDGLSTKEEPPGWRPDGSRNHYEGTANNEKVHRFIGRKFRITSFRRGRAGEAQDYDLMAQLHEKRRANPNAKRPKLPRKDMDYLVECAWKAGAWCQRGNKNYVKVYPANGSKMIHLSSTPSGSMTCFHKRKQLERAGIPVP